MILAFDVSANSLAADSRLLAAMSSKFFSSIFALMSASLRLLRVVIVASEPRAMIEMRTTAAAVVTRVCDCGPNGENEGVRVRDKR